MGRLSSLHMRVALLILAALIGACTLPALLVRPRSDGGLASARARWELHPVERYLLTVQETTDISSCAQTVAVERERITEVIDNGCGRLPSWTVSNLFMWAQSLEDGRSRCYPSEVTCVCHAVYSRRASFDEEAGFPRSISYEWTLEPNLRHPAQWQRIWRAGKLPTCSDVTRISGKLVRISVLSLTPLP